MLHILDKLGYQPEVAGNGREALEKTAERDFDLVFMDLEMPEMDGLEATQRLRSSSGENGPPLQPENGQPVVVGLSAHAGEGFRQKCTQAGMDDFLSKPVTLEDLRLVLQRWLGTGNGGQGAADHESAKAPEGKPLFDHHKLLEQLGGDAELLEQLLDIFIQDAPPRLERIRQALADEDWASLEQAVHTLKGSAASIGANTLYQSVHELGRACERNDRQRADRLLQQVESDVRTLQHALPGQE
jgi:CheY-like chemotaxis protein